MTQNFKSSLVPPQQEYAQNLSMFEDRKPWDGICSVFPVKAVSVVISYFSTNSDREREKKNGFMTLECL